MEDTKRRRLWNPAVDETMGKEQTSHEQIQSTQIDPRTTAFALTAFAQHHLMQQQQLQQLSTQPNQLQFLFQPYLSMALPLLNAHHNSQQTQKKKTGVRIKSVSPSESTPSKSPPLSTPASYSSSLTPSFNPIVKSALGIHVPNENCCAVCGACFRLTTDLVTHMRNNHRRNKFKRKSDE
ncbi:hypothetical protein PRIPAC_81595 [Pristionchus pacificus]|nr:hypothetical protein PRIPAC_81595 [Pristionchus pacificus]